MMGYYYGYGFAMFCAMLFIIALVIVGAILLYRSLASNNHGSYNNYKSDNAMQILNERYAKGEISDDEYKTKKEILRKS
jgi:putative membrane protein